MEVDDLVANDVERHHESQIHGLDILREHRGLELDSLVLDIVDDQIGSHRLVEMQTFLDWGLGRDFAPTREKPGFTGIHLATSGDEREKWDGNEL